MSQPTYPNNGDTAEVIFKKDKEFFMNNQQKQNIMAEEIWLNYFNNYLYDHEAITEDERNKMKNQILSHCDKKRKSDDKER